jgi:hypothetical protein
MVKLATLFLLLSALLLFQLPLHGAAVAGVDIGHGGALIDPSAPPPCHGDTGKAPGGLDTLPMAGCCCPAVCFNLGRLAAGASLAVPVAALKVLPRPAATGDHAGRVLDPDPHPPRA